MSIIQGFWIAAKKPLARRCRAGLCFDQAGHGVAADALTEVQIAALQNDPQLVVEAVEFSDDQAELLRAAGDLVEAGHADGHTDEQLSDHAHTLRAYLAGRQADGQGRPKVAEVKKAIGLDVSGADIASAWKALG